jgi:integrase
MASITTKKEGVGKGLKRLQFRLPGKQRTDTIYLGRMPMKQAETVRCRVEDLLHAMTSNTTPSPETYLWLGGISPKLRKDLEKFGLVGPARTAQRMTLQELVGQFMGTQVVKPATMAVYKQATSHLIAHLGSGCRVETITSSDLDGWKKALHADGLAPATVAKRVNVIKSLFNKAVDWAVVPASPAASLKRGSQRNPKRMVDVPREIAAKVIDHCFDPHSKAVIGLARYAGLRVPSELVGLSKGSIDWRLLRISVYSPKTNSTRIVPICPELATLLLPIATGCATDPLFPKIRSDTNLSTMVRRATARAGISPWPKTFQNLRRSCAQDISEMLPAHASAKIMGHSISVAANHYVSVTDHHFRKITHPNGDSGEHNATQNPTQNTSVDAGTQRNLEQQVPDESELVGSCASGEGLGMGGEGFEPP